MLKLSPAHLYRLSNLAAAGPRFYQETAYARRLEVLGLIEPTGRVDEAERTKEYAITAAGRTELSERYGVPPRPIPPRRTS